MAQSQTQFFFLFISSGETYQAFAQLIPVKRQLQISISETIDDVIVIVEFSMRDSQSAAMGGAPSGHQPASLAGLGASPRRPRELAGGAREVYIPAPGQPAFSIRALKQGGLIKGETACSQQLEGLAIEKEQLLTETPFSPHAPQSAGGCLQLPSFSVCSSGDKLTVKSKLTFFPLFETQDAVPPWCRWKHYGIIIPQWAIFNYR